MKAALYFKLPEEQEEFMLAQRGQGYKAVVEEMDAYLRGRLQYEALPEEVADALSKARLALAQFVDGAEAY